MQSIPSVICEGCNRPLNSAAEVFGPIGDTFCIACWMANSDWIEERHLIRREIFETERTLRPARGAADQAERDELLMRAWKLETQVEELTADICRHSSIHGRRPHSVH